MSHVIIVGGGIAGLVVARSFLQREHTVTVLEARDRIGGRIHTSKEGFSVCVEKGAEFIHGKQPLTFSLLEEANAAAVRLSGNHYTVYKDEIENGSMIDDQWRVFNKELKKVKVDVSLDNFIKQHFSGEEFVELRERVIRFAEGFDIADTTKASAKQLGDEWKNNDEEHQYHVKGGYQEIVRFLESEVKTSGGSIELTAPVIEIVWKRGLVQAITKGGKKFTADKIIVTVPASTMQHDHIRFTPAIPAHTKAFKKLGVGGVIKFMFEFSQPFWETARSHAFKNTSFIFSDATVPTWWSQLPETTPVLTGWLGGPPAIRGSHDRPVLYEQAINSLTYILKCPGTEVQSFIRHWDIADWVVEPYSLGAYTYPTLESPQAKAFLSKGIEDTVFFGGEALYDGKAPGTVEAAISHAIQVAENANRVTKYRE